MTNNNYSLRILEHVNLILRFKSQREKRQASGQKSKNTSTKVSFLTSLDPKIIPWDR